MNDQLEKYLLLTLGEDYKKSPYYAIISQAFIEGYKSSKNDCPSFC